MYLVLYTEVEEHKLKVTDRLSNAGGMYCTL